MKVPHYFQQNAVDALFDFFARDKGNPLVVMPTGTGKSLTMALFIRQAIEAFPNCRVIVATHVKELIVQDFMELIELWPCAPAGVYSASVGRRDTRAPIIFAGVQSVRAKASLFGFRDLLLVDEAHRISRQSATSYGQFIAGLRAENPALKTIGFTATPYRLGEGLLYEGDGAMFTDVAYEVFLADMVREGYLAPVTSAPVSASVDFTGVKKAAGEYVASEVEARFEEASIEDEIVADIVAKGENRRSWLVFAANKKRAAMLQERLERHVPTGLIFGDTKDRGGVVGDFKAGRLRCLVNVDVLTTGFDHKPIDLIADVAPTSSPGLHVQKLGRGTRVSKATGKVDCLLLDYAGNAARHGPLDQITAPRRKGPADGDAPLKTCDGCGALLHASRRQCPHCGFLFPEPETELLSSASAAPAMSFDIAPQWLQVSDCYYSEHRKPGKPATMLAAYRSGILTYKEWVCFDHPQGSFPRRMADAWWKARSDHPAPQSVADAVAAAMQGRCRRPKQIEVRMQGKYFAVTDARF